EVKAVDGAYPMIGSVESEPAAPVQELLAERDGVHGALVDPVLLDRLGLAVGDIVSLGNARVALRARLVSEPDKIAAGVGFGPRLLMSQEGLAATGLVQPGSLVRWTYRVALPDASGGERALERLEAGARQRLPDAGWQIRSRNNASPQFARNLERSTQLLTLVGLTALMVGGVGVANAVNAFVERKLHSIATLKSLGAPGGQVVAVYLTQVMIIAAVGIAIGLALGAAMPFAVAHAAKSLLPLPL